MSLPKDASSQSSSSEQTPSQKAAQPKTSISSLSALLGRYFPILRVPLLFLFLCEIGLIIPALALPAFSQVFVDRFIDAHDYSWSGWLFLGILLAIGLLMAFTFLQERILSYLRVRLSISMGNNLLWHLFRLPMEFFSADHAKEAAYRLSLINSVAASLTHNVIKNGLDILLIVVYVLVIAYYNIYIALIALSVGILDILLVYMATKWRFKEINNYQKRQKESDAYSLDMLGSIKTIKAMGLESEIFSRWASRYTRVLQALHDIGKKDIFLGVLPPFLIGVSIVAFIAIAGIEVLHGHLNAGAFVALQMLLASFMLPISRLINSNQGIQLLKADLARIEEILSYPVDNAYIDNIENSALKKLEGYVELKKVSYRYENSLNETLKEIDLSLHPGKAIAIVGPTGSGKTTLAWLIAGLLEPTQGEILFDNQANDAISKLRKTSSLALIERTPFIFKGTIKENLSLLNPFLHHEDMVKACKDACIHEDVVSKVGGYDFEVEDNGANLSMGENQRLEIARGLLKNPSILILDEATNNIDSGTASQVIRNIHRHGCTLIIIAHRLKSIQFCDEIYLLDSGKIVAHGAHANLIVHSNAYAEYMQLEEKA